MKQFNLNIDEILQPQDWGFPVPIAYGPGRVKEISSFCKNLNINNPLIVTDSGSKDLNLELANIYEKEKNYKNIYVIKLHKT